MDEPLLIYGLQRDSQKLKHVKSVPNGLICNCVCPKCNEPLVAKNNPKNKKTAHFAHTNGSNCVGAYQSALHLLVKQVFKETRKLRTPDYFRSCDPFDFSRTGKMIEFEEVHLEERIVDEGGEIIVADAIATIHSKKVIIEFAFTHFIDESKNDKISKLSLPCIEADISCLTLDTHQIASFLLTKSNEIYWITNPRYEQEYRTHLLAIKDWKRKERKRIKEEQKRIDDEQRLKVERQRQLKLEREDAAIKKYDNFRYSGKYKFYSVINGHARKCPIIEKELEEMKDSWFYRNNTLKRIIDGEFWQGTLYGYRPNECYIYLNEEKIIVYPALEKRKMMTEQESNAANSFFRGLKTISELFEKNGTCRGCKHNIDTLNFDNKTLSVCSYHL